MERFIDYEEVYGMKIFSVGKGGAPLIECLFRDLYLFFNKLTTVV